MGNKPYSNLYCPECGSKGEYQIDDNEEIFCTHCGLVISSPFPYSAGMKFKTLDEILDDKINPERLRALFNMYIFIRIKR